MITAVGSVRARFPDIRLRRTEIVDRTFEQNLFLFAHQPTKFFGPVHDHHELLIRRLDAQHQKFPAARQHVVVRQSPACEVRIRKERVPPRTRSAGDAAMAATIMREAPR